MKNLRCFFLAAFLLLADPCSAETTASGIVAGIRSSTDFVMTDGRNAKMTGVYVPTAWEDRARQWLETQIKNTPLTLAAAGTDRYGQPLIEPDSEMLRQGLGLAMPDSQDQGLAAKLYAAESDARKNKRGLWEKENDFIFSASKPETIPADSFVIVEGKILQVAEKKTRTYINFGDDWKTDFTLSIPPSARGYFQDIDFQSWTGKNIRARGWVEKYNGPTITLTHPAQIEILPQ